MLTVTSYSFEYMCAIGLDFEAAGDSIVCYFVSNYLLRGFGVPVNMTWVLFCG